MISSREVPDVEPCRGGRGRAFDLSPTDAKALGYTETEYVLRGTASSYLDAGPDELAIRGHAPYVTRMLVRTPGEGKKFTGAVVVEWLNVAGFVDASVEWTYTHTELTRRGLAWVGVSMQCAGVTGSPQPVDGIAPGGLKAWDPDRYGHLSHPGDDYSYDMYSQAGHAIRNLFPGARIIAAGMSQAAYRLTTYINKIDRTAEVYDGFLTHCRPGAAAPLVLPSTPTIDPQPVAFRDDPRVPVLAVQTETDVITLGYLQARQPDSETFRLWEVAGAAHADTYLDAASTHDVSRLDAAELAAALAPRPRVCGVTLDYPANSAPQHHYVANAALYHLDRWLRDDVPPPSAPRLETVRSSLVRDTHGNAIGGIRTPWMDVPLAVLTGISPDDGLLERLFGRTTPFAAATRNRLYPDADTYRAAFDAATDEAVQKGFLLRADAPEIKALATAAYTMAGTPDSLP